jgi:hypothetical protein
MTTMIATVTERAAWLSQDSALSDSPAALAGIAGAGDVMAVRSAEDWGRALKQGLAGAGATKAATPIGFASKIIVVPHLRMAIGGSGSYRFHLAWARSVLAGLTGARSIEEVDAAAPELLKRFHNELNPSLPQYVCHIGWSIRQGRALGFIYASGDGFRSLQLLAGQGHSLTPAPATDDGRYDALCDAWGPAAVGQGTLAFHAAVAANQFRTQRRGLYTNVPCIGGVLTTVAIDGDGIVTRTTDVFPGGGGAGGG